MNSDKKPLLEIILMYWAIGGAGAFVINQLAHIDPLPRFLVADLAMTAVTFGLSLHKRNSSVYDAYWSVIPFYFLLFWFADGGSGWGWPQWLSAATVSLWSWRLTHNWYRSWSGWSHEDWRYVNFRRQFGRHFFWVNLSAIHLYPTLIVFLAMSGLFWLFGETASVSTPLLLAGNALALMGVWLEHSADTTLYRSRRDPSRQPGTCLRDGLWGRMRHPNYLGEMLFWIGVALVGLSAAAPWWTALGALGMVLMFVFASIPMKEARLAATRSDFDDYRKQVRRWGV